MLLGVETGTQINLDDEEIPELGADEHKPGADESSGDEEDSSTDGGSEEAEFGNKPLRISQDKRKPANKSRENDETGEKDEQKETRETENSPKDESPQVKGRKDNVRPEHRLSEESAPEEAENDDYDDTDGYTEPDKSDDDKDSYGDEEDKEVDLDSIARVLLGK